MKTLTTFAAAAALFTVAAAAHADTSYDQYRRVVLGDTTIAAPAAATRTTFVPGSYAQYLIINGTSKSEALVAAARIGEHGQVQTVAAQAPQRQLTPAQAYAKYLGNDGLGNSSNEAVNSAE